MRGTIEKLKDTYGFIRGDDGGSYFFIPSSLVGGADGFAALNIGNEVEFDSTMTERGRRAANVVAIASRMAATVTVNDED